MKVLFLPEVEDYLYKLTKVLYQKGYFVFKESAVEYIIDLENDIKNNLPNCLHKSCKERPFYRGFWYVG